MENKILALILAGGEGQRLHPLTRDKAKPAVPFAGVYRMIDFTLSNCLNSGTKRIFVLTQTKALPLERHLRMVWIRLFRPELGEFLETISPQQRIVRDWYRGTADAVFQNIDLLSDLKPVFCLVLSGDHVYRMDYRAFLNYHIVKGAEVTIACTSVPREEARRFGVLQVDESDRIVGFAEKPENPQPIPNFPDLSLVSMGIYLFNTETLVRAVIADSKTSNSSHDFGKDVIPKLVQQGKRLFAFNIKKELPLLFHYWQDIGTLDSYYEAHLDLLRGDPTFPLHGTDWPVRGGAVHLPPAWIQTRATVTNSFLSPGCIIENGALVEDSVLSPGVKVEEGAAVKGCVILNDVVVGSKAFLYRVIADERTRLPAGIRVGDDPERDQARFVVTSKGVTVVPSRIILEERSAKPLPASRKG
ncbi:MAG: glucose-1-phosphate adenylyltransferase [Armatimonadetes bacterium]|nr:glucose-1-phosphate adenylyltransferase [Armatimonadota bacterium]MDW8121225.1 glucose-1-phosphate adenylyltransferase [Armatimonadota bacterium]